MVQPKITLEQYKILLKRKEEAERYGERIRYKDLCEAWGISQSTIGTMARRGIKLYDTMIWKEQQNDNNRQRISTGSVARRNS